MNNTNIFKISKRKKNKKEENKEGRKTMSFISLEYSKAEVFL
jgi:hypothetical protein